MAEINDVSAKSRANRSYIAMSTQCRFATAGVGPSFARCRSPLSDVYDQVGLVFSTDLPAGRPQLEVHPVLAIGSVDGMNQPSELETFRSERTNPGSASHRIATRSNSRYSAQVRLPNGLGSGLIMRQVVLPLRKDKKSGFG